MGRFKVRCVRPIAYTLLSGPKVVGPTLCSGRQCGAAVAVPTAGVQLIEVVSRLLQGLTHPDHGLLE